MSGILWTGPRYRGYIHLHVSDATSIQEAEETVSESTAPTESGMQFGIFTVSDITQDPTTGYTPSEAERIRGLKSADVEAALGFTNGPLIHADDLALLAAVDAAA